MDGVFRGEGVGAEVRCFAWSVGRDFGAKFKVLVVPPRKSFRAISRESAKTKKSGAHIPEPRRLTDEELAEIRRRRPGVRASLACEGMYLTSGEEALFEQMDKERLTPDERAARLTAFSREKRRLKARASA